jgi:phosphoserine phosphatase RsbU/P
MMSALELEQINGPTLSAKRWRVSEPFRLGRADGNELELPDPGISRRHAAIERNGAGWIIRDCGTRVGLRLNELALAPSDSAKLGAGDVLGIGPWRFRINAIEAEAPAHDESDSATRISLIRTIGNLAEQRLELLLRYADDIAVAEDESVLAEIMAEHALLGSGFARATVLWCKGDQVLISCQRPEVSAESIDGWRYNESLIASARKGDIARLEVEAADATANSGSGTGVRRALCVPLMLDGYAHAFLYLDSNRAGTRRHADAPTFCQGVARLAALALANLHRLESEREHAAYAADLDRAREVQHRLLPASEGRMGGCEYALRLHPGRVVAGDIADVFEIDRGKVVVVLGDVSGAGIGAGLVMASVQSFLRAGFAHDADPARAVSLLNKHLCAQSSGGRFVTLWLGVFEADGRHCQFVDAGHGHALRIRSTGVEAFPVEGAIPLGIDANAEFVAEALLLERGETLVLYSDGIIEQRDASGTAFSGDGLAAAIASAASPAAAIAQAWHALEEHAAGSAPEDDATLLAISGSD